MVDVFVAIDSGGLGVRLRGRPAATFGIRHFELNEDVLQFVLAK